MKRSEMIEILQSYIDNQTCYDYYINPESILELIEEAGMLPPRCDLPKLGISDNAWEPEDE